METAVLFTDEDAFDFDEPDGRGNHWHSMRETMDLLPSLHKGGEALVF